MSRLVPVVFVLLWSSGFIGAKLGLRHADPLAFLLLRNVLVAVSLSLISIAVATPLPRRLIDGVNQAIVGALIQGLYLAGFYLAISWGLSAGTAALIVCFQPLIVAVLAGRLLGEPVAGRTWVGLSLGLVGCCMVVWRNIAFAASSAAILATIVSLISICLGNLYQKRLNSDMHPFMAGIIQQAGGLCVFTLMLPLAGPLQIDWTSGFVLAILWATLGVGVGAFTLLMVLFKHSEATRVSSLFFMVPPVTAGMAWFTFGERVTNLELGGMAVALGGVILASRKREIPKGQQTKSA